MLNHPMLQMREPPPEIDVTQPAIPVNLPWERIPQHGGDPGYGPAPNVIPLPSKDPKHPSNQPQPDSADPEREAPADFKAGDRVMVWHINYPKPAIYIGNGNDARTLKGTRARLGWCNIRHPTAAELLEHWGEK